MNLARLVSASFAVSLVAFAAGCSAAAATEEASQDEAALASAASATTTYAGSFDLGGETFGLEVAVRHAATATVGQKVWSTRWHTTPIGRCGAYTDGQDAVVGFRVTDAAGKVLVDDEGRASSEGSIDLDGTVECKTGILSSPRAITSLPVSISRNGIEASLDGQRVFLPAGYGSSGLFTLEAAGTFEAQSPLQFRVTDRVEESGYNSSEAITARGTLTTALPKELVFHVGTADFFAEPLAVTLTAR